MKYIKLLLLAVIICALSLTAISCSGGECPHNFVDGKCTKCGESDPDYSEPQHTVEYTELSDGTYMLTKYSSTEDNNIVRIPETYEGKAVTAIGKEVFKNTKKEAFYIPSSVKKIEADAFLYIYGINEKQFEISIYYDGTVSDWMNIEFETRYSNPLGMTVPHLYLKDGSQYSELKKLNIPAGTTSVPDYAFFNLAYADELTLPEGLTEIGHSAFSGISASTVTLPSTLEYIGDQAFAFTSFEMIKIPASVKFIGTRVFQGCNSTLKAIIFEGSPTWHAVTEYQGAHVFDAVKSGTAVPASEAANLLKSDGTPDYDMLCNKQGNTNFFGFIKG